MIKFSKSTPNIYNKESRDFQFIGRLFDTVFNHVKMNVDTIYNNPLSENSDTSLLTLMTKTLGFETKHRYDVADLYTLCTAFKSILMYKGTVKSIEDTVNVLLRAQNNVSKTKIEVDKKNKTVTILVPSALQDTVLIDDVLDYILPAGFTYSIISAYVSEETSADSEFITKHRMQVTKASVTMTGKIYKPNIENGIDKHSTKGIIQIDEKTGYPVEDKGAYKSEIGAGITYENVIISPNGDIAKIVKKKEEGETKETIIAEDEKEE